MPTILATGFGAFPGAPVNPTEWLMDDLRGWHPAGATLETRMLPVTYDVWPELESLVAETKPDAVVAFGLSGKAAGITLETTARNVFAVDRPDAAGKLAPAKVIRADGPATIPAHVVDLPFVRSDDAGDYICNFVLYRLLAAGHRASFVHVPPFEQLDREALRDGARAILEATSKPLLFQAR